MDTLFLHASSLSIGGLVQWLPEPLNSSDVNIVVRAFAEKSLVQVRDSCLPQ